MTDYVPDTITENTTILSEQSHSVPFRPVQPGTIGVAVIPQFETTRTETGLLARIVLYRPGVTGPIAEAKVSPSGGGPLILSYTATAADLVPAGDWSCQVANETLGPGTFDTTVTFPSLIPIEQATATFDVELLNTLLAEAIVASGLALNLQSSGDPSQKDSSVTWSVNMASTLPGSLRDETSYLFYFPDYRYTWATVNWAMFRIMGLDTGGVLPQVVVSLQDGGPVVSVTMAFSPSNARLVNIEGAPPAAGLVINVSELSLNATISFAGTLVSATCQATAVGAIGPVSFDLGGPIGQAIQGWLTGWLTTARSDLVRQYLDDFFVNLMRLGAQATIDNYTIDPLDQTLTVSYTNPFKFPVTTQGTNRVPSGPGSPVSTTSEGG